MRTNVNNITTIDVSALPPNARQELFDFYSFLLVKYKDASHDEKQLTPKSKFSKFLSISVNSDEFEMLNRDERNAR